MLLFFVIGAPLHPAPAFSLDPFRGVLKVLLTTAMIWRYISCSLKQEYRGAVFVLVFCAGLFLWLGGFHGFCILSESGSEASHPSPAKTCSLPFVFDIRRLALIMSLLCLTTIFQAGAMGLSSRAIWGWEIQSFLTRYFLSLLHPLHISVLGKNRSAIVRTMSAPLDGNSSHSSFVDRGQFFHGGVLRL